MGGSPSLTRHSAGQSPTFQPNSPLTLWIAATLIEGADVVVDVELFHSAQQGAEADEQLSWFVREFKERMLKPD